MDKTLIDTVKGAMTERKINARKLAVATGIPSDRIYKWLQRGLSPKAEDALKLQAWLDGENVVKVPNGAEEPAEDYGQKKDPLLGDLIVSTRKLSDSNLINAENIRRLITLLEFSLGKQNTAPVEHLPGPPIPLQDHGPAKVENLKDKKQGSPSRGKSGQRDS